MASTTTDLQRRLRPFQRRLQLRDALGNRQGDRAGKAELVSSLLEGRTRPETLRLARQAVLAPRGRRFSRTIEEYLQVAAERRQQYTAVVTDTANQIAALVPGLTWQIQ